MPYAATPVRPAPAVFSCRVPGTKHFTFTPAYELGVPVGDLARAACHDRLPVRPNAGGSGGLLVSVVALEEWANAPS
jgi:hypothetical protein